jgi:hypothetical protein
VIKKIVVASFAVVGLLGLALAVGAQGPGGPGPGPGGRFGRGGHGGPGGPGGWASAKCSPNCPQYQFAFSRTTTRAIFVPGPPASAKTVTETSTGVIAADNYGSTYRQVTLPAWGSSSTSQEFIYVKDLDPGVLMDYIENVTKGTYEEHAIKVRTPPAGAKTNPNWKGGPGGKPPDASTNGVTHSTGAYSISDNTYTCPSPDAETTTVTRGASTSTRVYCSVLHVVLYETRTDPRFGTSTYQLSKYASTPAAGVLPFKPTGTLVQPKFDHHRRGPGGNGQQAPPAI